MSKRLLMLGFGHQRQTTNILFKALCDKLAERHTVKFVLREFPSGVFAKALYQISIAARDVAMVVKCDHLIVYASAALSIFAIITARLLNRQVTLFVWDIYPDAKAEALGKSLDLPGMRFHAILERLAIHLADAILVPSVDYARHPMLIDNPRVVEFPLWPTAPLHLSPQRRSTIRSDLSLVFPGQLLASRDIQKALAHLASVSRKTVSLDVYEPGRTVAEEAPLHDGGKLRFLPAIEPAQLSSVLANYDFGLVSLAAEYALPAAPSKTLAYLAAGLPVIYYGPPNAFMAKHVHGKIGVDLSLCKDEGEFLAVLSDVNNTHAARFSEAYADLELNWSRLETIF